MSATEVEDVYGLSPMQLGMLLHTVHAPASGMYCIQISYALRGRLDAAAFERAWQSAVDRHPVLRTSFHWEDLEKPLQVVHRGARLGFTHHDWRAEPLDRREARLAELLVSEGRRGFVLTTPPLLRLTLIHWGEDDWRLVLAHHHLLLDGWCKPTLFREVFDTYEAMRNGTRLDLPPVRPYRDFVAWLQQQDLSGAEAFWRAELAGARAATRLAAGSRRGGSGPGDRYVEYHVELSEAATATLRERARAERVTLNTVVQGLWGLLLGVRAGSTDVVFGATVSGRPAALAGADTMLGLFINTLPVRVRTGDGDAVFPWLRDLQARQLAAREFDFAPLVEIQRWSDVPKGEPLFETIVVFENNLGYGGGTERYGSLEIGDVRPVIRNSFPLTLRVVPDRSLSMQVLYEADRFTGADVAGIGGDLAALLEAIPATPAPTLAALAALLRASADRRSLAEQEKLRSLGGERLRAVRRRATGTSGQPAGAGGMTDRA